MWSAREIARRLGGQVAGRDRVLAPGPGHSAQDRSLSIRLDPKAPDCFWVNSFAGDDWQHCRDHVRLRLGLPLVAGARAPADHRPRTSERTDQCRPLVDRTIVARRVWDEAGPVAGSPAATYLAARGVCPPIEVFESSALRFHAACPFRLTTGETIRLPAMLGAMRDIRTDAFRGIHRTALAPDGRDKAAVPGLGNPKKMLGPATVAAIKLTPHAEIGAGLHLAEGIETALACLAHGFRPIWVALSAGGVARFPVLPNVSCLTLFADHDQSRTGLAAARSCARRWTAAGAEAVILYRNTLGLDFADPAGVRS